MGIKAETLLFTLTHFRSIRHRSIVGLVVCRAVAPSHGDEFRPRLLASPYGRRDAIRKSSVIPEHPIMLLRRLGREGSFLPVPFNLNGAAN